MFHNLVQSAARKAFDLTDVDKSGKLDLKEMYICILTIYDYLNRWLPLQLKPPGLSQVKETMKKNDHDDDAQLTYQEFLPVVKALVFRPSRWQESVVARFGWAMTVKFIVTPLAAGFVLKTLVNMNWTEVEKHPFLLTTIVDTLLRYTILF